MRAIGSPSWYPAAKTRSEFCAAALTAISEAIGSFSFPFTSLRLIASSAFAAWTPVWKASQYAALPTQSVGYIMVTRSGVVSISPGGSVRTTS